MCSIEVMDLKVTRYSSIRKFVQWSVGELRKISANHFLLPVTSGMKVGRHPSIGKFVWTVGELRKVSADRFNPITVNLLPVTIVG